MTLDSNHRSRLEALEALEKAATPGPWEFSDSTDVRGHKGEFRAPSPHNGFMLVGPWTNSEDAALIVEARNLLPALFAVAREAAKMIGGDWHADCEPVPTKADERDVLGVGCEYQALAAALRPLLAEGDAR